LNNGKPKTKDQSSNKFLQRIAGKKAIGPPPTPRPIIGEHPVRTLLRENADKIEEIRPDAPVRTEAQGEGVSPPVALEQAGSALRVGEEPSPSGDGATSRPESTGGGIVGEKGGKSPAPFVAPDQEPRAAVSEELSTSKGTKRAGAVKARTEPVGSAPDLSRAEEAVINIRKKYRLNGGEFSLYRELYLMTHAVGKTECSFVASELVKSTGMLERRVRDNLRRLKKNGWLVLLEGYDFENREKAKYRVNTEPGL
jgi:hypothetical protein